MNLPFAAAATSQVAFFERMRQVPPEFWWKMAIGIGAVVAAVIILRKVAKMNPLLLSIGLAFAGAMIGMNWIYERNEPKWATPVVQVVAGFLPAKGRL